MFLGADTIRPLLRKLVPQAEVIRRPRFSTLTYTGPKKITRLPRRSAVVAFSADRSLRARRADAPPARRLRRRHGRPVAAHAQCPGGDVPVRRGRLHGRHRRHRHGPQHGRGPCRLRAHDQVRRPRLAPPDGAGDRADRRPRRPPHEQRHASAPRPRSVRSSPSWWRRWRITASIRIGTLYLAQHRSGFPQPRRACCSSLDRQPPAPGLIRVRDADDHAGAGGAGARSRAGRSRALARPPAAVVGGLPDPGFPQDADRRRTRGFSPRSIRYLASRAVRAADRLGRRSRSPASTAPKATSTRWCSASPISAPGPTSPIAATGWPMPSIGRSATRAVEDKLSDALHQR